MTNYVVDTKLNSKFGFCTEKDEMVNQIISGCGQLAEKEYKIQLEKWSTGIRKKIEIWPLYQSVVENETHTNPWDIKIQINHLMQTQW